MKLLLLSIITLCLFCLYVNAGIYNGDFEIVDPNENNLVPSGWQGENYAFYHSEFTPSPENGQQLVWLVDPVLPFHGEKFVVLSTGDIGPDSSITYAKLTTTFTAGPEQVITGKYFFGTCDYIPYFDKATIRLIPTNGRRPLLLLTVTVENVGTYCSMPGWKSFSYRFSSTQFGEYTFEARVDDIDDTIYKSYFMLDNIRVVNAPPACDYYPDLVIDMKDIGVLNSHLGQDSTDPNNMCEYTNVLGEINNIDYNGDGVVDEQDMLPLAEYWLWRTEEY